MAVSEAGLALLASMWLIFIGYLVRRVSPYFGNYIRYLGFFVLVLALTMIMAYVVPYLDARLG